jgi:site-specific recombinase XerD
LRHSLGASSFFKGADLSVVAEVLGHKDIKTTKIYTHLPREKLLIKYDDALKSM